MPRKPARDPFVLLVFSLTPDQALAMRGDATRTHYEANHRASEIPGLLAWCRSKGIARAWLDGKEVTT